LFNEDFVLLRQMLTLTSSLIILCNYDLVLFGKFFELLVRELLQNANNQGGK